MKMIAKLVAFLLFFCIFSKLSYAAQQYSCSYKADPKARETNLDFTLPDDYKFGMLIPVELKTSGDKSGKSSMNTVVIKDKPYMVLSDLYRIQSKNSSMVLLMFSPDGVTLNVAFINMGENPNAIFFNGKCIVR